MKPVFSINNDEEEDPLQKQFKTLELEWDSIKQSISRSSRRSSTTFAVAGDHNIIHPYADSPKELMALLQNEYSPNSGIIEEVDFDDGVLRGRRLFEESEVDSDVDNGLHGGCFDLDEKSEVSTRYVFNGFEEYDETYDRVGGLLRSCTDSPKCDVAEKGVRVAAKSGGSVGRWFVSVVVMLFALVIVAFECSSEDKHILVPT